MPLEGLGDDALEDVEEGEAAAGGALAEELGEGGDAAHADGGGGVGVERLHERHHDLLEQVGLVHVPVGQHRLRHDGQALGPHGVALVGPVVLVHEGVQARYPARLGRVEVLGAVLEQPDDGLGGAVAGALVDEVEELLLAAAVLLLRGERLERRYGVVEVPEDLVLAIEGWRLSVIESTGFEIE